MPKLVIKQDLPEPSTQEKLEGVLRLVLPVLLLVVTAAAALSFYLAREPETAQVAAGTTEFETPLVYKRQQERLNAMVSEFESQEKDGLDGYDKHVALLDKSDQILQQVEEMNGIVESLGIAAKDKQSLLARHQYQQDYWEAKRVFHDLRLARFMKGGQPTALPAEVETASVPSSAMKPAGKDGVVDNSPQPASATTDVTPKPDLPADFCPLFGPGAAACKPGADGKK